ncbi:RNA polymerase sigma factor [Nonomuraea roseoviolacea]|uniref:RNA polymerase sigma-70 factor (ECF subfamily) n=1 Tax=Nonomuraea roseoviolacea subsp. carminata TaxID=160689 RepID=A0ABT1K328_9ACTN|nr:sigma-70 family RNA polymerase sigma factor [Nonomuraea roseoviolacea]MCP2348054.1 RNA polymerase sigma-70 factor (ECF subfamily) [Nonomuraea roseoviolacea subsp. carminata]
MSKQRKEGDIGEPAPEHRFERLYLAHYPAIAAYVTRRTESTDDIADVIAETFTTAWRRLDDIPQGDEARLWLYAVARRVLANHFRAEERRSALAARLREELSAWSRPVADRDGDATYQAFRRLSPDDRELLTLVGWEGLSSAEIAKVLGCSRGAARLRLHRARKRLAKELAAADLDLTTYGLRAVTLAEGKS